MFYFGEEKTSAVGAEIGGGAELGHRLGFGHVESARLCEADNNGNKEAVQLGLDPARGTTTISRIRRTLSSQRFMALLKLTTGIFLDFLGTLIPAEDDRPAAVPEVDSFLVTFHLGVSTVRLGSYAGWRGGLTRWGRRTCRVEGVGTATLCH